MKDGLIVFAGSSNQPLAERIAAHLGIKLGEILLSRFSDGEIRIQIFENVRGKDVFVIQSTSYDANFHIMQLLLIIDALRRASARRINAVIPYFGYARQDRKDRPRVPISARLVADLIETAGAHRVITVDLHAGQIQGFFRIPLDHLMAFPVFVEHIKSMNLENVVFVSPDAGGVERAMALARKLNGSFAVLDKRREKPNVAEIIHVIGDVKGKVAFLVDDIVDTAGTLVKAAEALKKSGAKKIYAAATHGVLSGPALERIENSEIEELIITDTIDVREKVKNCGKIKVLSISKLLAEAIIRVHEERSITELFK